MRISRLIRHNKTSRNRSKYLWGTPFMRKLAFQINEKKKKDSSVKFAQLVTGGKKDWLSISVLVPKYICDDHVVKCERDNKE